MLKFFIYSKFYIYIYIVSYRKNMISSNIDNPELPLIYIYIYKYIYIYIYIYSYGWDFLMYLCTHISNISHYFCFGFFAILSTSACGVGARSISTSDGSTSAQKVSNPPFFSKSFLITMSALEWPFGGCLLFIIYLFIYSISIFYEPFNYVTHADRISRKNTHTYPVHILIFP